jgi:MoxR-like ATPase
MLLDAYRRKRFILLLDGVDEAPHQLQNVLQQYITEKLANEGHRFVVTSRPEAVLKWSRDALFVVRNRFAVLDLEPYTAAQQEEVLR